MARDAGLVSPISLGGSYSKPGRVEAPAGNVKVLGGGLAAPKHAVASPQPTTGESHYKTKSLPRWSSNLLDG